MKNDLKNIRDKLRAVAYKAVLDPPDRLFLLYLSPLIEDAVLRVEAKSIFANIVRRR